MASTLFKTLNSFSNLTTTSRTSINALNHFARKFYSTRRLCNRRNLFARISPLGDPEISVIPILDQWVHEGGKVQDFELRRIVRDLRNCRRYGQALEVSEWMSSKEFCPSSPRDCAVRLDLIGRVRGLDSAESYFNSLIDQEKVDKTYGSLLNCYVREGLVDKSLSHLQKMKQMGFASSPLTYNDIMCLYTRTNQLEKIPGVLSEMKENGVSPDNYSYRICMNSYVARSDLKNMEKVLEEMESQPHISMDWTTYSMVANFYIREGIHEKALTYLMKCEEKVNQEALGYNHLISHYANLGNKAEMMRLWRVRKEKCKKLINRDYITMLGSLVKLGELEETEKLLGEWELSCQCYDFRVPNILLIGYSQKGLIEKAEAMVRDIVKKGRTPTPNSWGIIAAGYVDQKNMEKAFECVKEALAVQSQNKGWRPKPKVMTSILNWLSESGKSEQLEEFVNSLETLLSVKKADVRSEKEEGLLESLEDEQIDENEGRDYPRLKIDLP